MVPSANNELLCGFWPVHVTDNSFNWSATFPFNKS
jgi:hypothetical protein